jgi:hypothetical protein
VVLESDDQGAVDMFGNPTYRGNVYRYNYWHHLGNWERKGEAPPTGQAGIRLDDAICGVLIQGNVFERCSAGALGFGGVQIHGGKDNVVEGNLFVDCSAAMSFSPWGEQRWRNYTGRALEASAIDRDLYLQRYPALARLGDDHDVNTIRNNVALRCGRLLLRAPAGLKLAGNSEVADCPELKDGPDGRLTWNLQTAERLGLTAIPFGRIGLSADEYRQERKGTWTLTSDRPGRE